MITVQFNESNLYREGIVLEEFDIGMPEKKVNKISILGRNGELDMTKALTGYTHFSNRTIQLVLGLTGSEEKREDLRVLLFLSYYDKQIKLRFSHLEGYFLGRVHFHS